MNTTESQIELDLVAKLGDLKYTYRPDIGDRAALDVNFREKFQALNRVERITAQSQKIDVPARHVAISIVAARKATTEKSSVGREGWGALS